MRRTLPDGYEFDDDPQRIDVDAVHAYLTRSYWAEGRSREAVARLVDDAARVVGLYQTAGRSASAGRSPTVRPSPTWRTSTCWMPTRARAWAWSWSAEMVDHGDLAAVRWYLHTRDAAGLYRRFGFGPPSERGMERNAGGAAAR